MKRGKEDEKNNKSGMMFARINVNDTEKGGPKAPPMNKTALYEQLCIPSQTFNSSTKGNDNKRPMFFPLQLPLSRPLVDNSNATFPDSNTSLAAPPKRLDEEDFTVPVFVEPENGRNNKHSKSVDQENVSLSRPAQIKRFSRNKKSPDKEQKQNSTMVSNLIQKGRGQRNELQCSSEDQEDREQHLTDDVDGVQGTNDALYHEAIDKSPLQSVHNTTLNVEYHKDKTGNLLSMQIGDRNDDDSDTSMLDSVSGLSITPNDIVGVIGQKHFWKARREIVNQQRVFAVQVFELHRLIKVQKLFAGSSNLALEDAAFLGKTLKTSIPKEITLEIIVTSPANMESPKEKLLNNHSEKTEVSAENAVEKSSLSTSQNVRHHHPTSQIPFPAHPQSTPVTTDSSASPLYFNRPTGHHWLVPVMSPTEGLIYKPYAGPEHTGSNPMMSNFPNPLYGMPSSHPYGIPNSHPYGIPNSHPYGLPNSYPYGTPNSHPYEMPHSHPYGTPNSHPFFQGFGLPPGFSSMPNYGYFPPYSMPPMGPGISGSVVDQGIHFTGTSCNEQQQDSCSGSKPNTPNLIKTRMGKDRDLQDSTASSPREGKNRFLHSPTYPVDDFSTENPTRVIKVVPHNPVSANESAFRIFQSIQKEREQSETVKFVFLFGLNPTVDERGPEVRVL